MEKLYPDNNFEYYDYKGDHVESFNSATGEVCNGAIEGRSIAKEVARFVGEYKNHHCCEDMNFHIDFGEVHIYYDAKWRIYGIDYKDDFGDEIELMDYCPWCGSKLADRLSEKWWNELKGLGFIDPISEDIPEEFKTDEWWTKRGL